MYVLVIEDEEDFSEELLGILSDVPNYITHTIARSRNSALELIDSEFFDLIILDLKIPTVDGALDATPVHGNAVFSKAREKAPGTPIFLLTGSPVEDFVPVLLEHQQQEDIWGTGRNFGTVDFLKKYNFDEFPEKLKPIVNAVQCLSEVELDRTTLDLSIQEDRLVRIFARKFDGARCVVTPLSFGLSGTKVVRLQLTDNNGAPTVNAVAKLGSREDIRNETQRFKNYITRLEPVATPRYLDTLEFGAKANAGIFYSLEGSEDTAFFIATRPEDFCKNAIQSLADVTHRWSDGVPETRVTIRDVRQRILSDDALDHILEKFSLPWVREFEQKSLQTKWCCIHGDLHGCNVLVKTDGSSIIIDYGDVEYGPASLDPVTLELSLFFHPQGPFHPQGSLAGCGWPSEEHVTNWGNLDQYLDGCPSSHFIRECRGWTHTIAAGKREIAASAYSYLIRQLKYSDTDKEAALALLNSVKAFFDNT